MALEFRASPVVRTILNVNEFAHSTIITMQSPFESFLPVRGEDKDIHRTLQPLEFRASPIVQIILSLYQFAHSTTTMIQYPLESFLGFYAMCLMQMIQAIEVLAWYGIASFTHYEHSMQRSLATISRLPHSAIRGIEALAWCGAASSVHYEAKIHQAIATLPGSLSKIHYSSLIPQHSMNHFNRVVNTIQNTSVQNTKEPSLMNPVTALGSASRTRSTI
ncbi:MAG: hypothetical protein M1827_001759 [Pycnora praestabilis]|nr:MAG: hypothetical protein M1827_001759 [Pycnora praestabilis]